MPAQSELTWKNFVRWAPTSGWNAPWLTGAIWASTCGQRLRVDHSMELPDREVRVGKEYHNWCWVLRLGDSASGGWSQRIYDLSPTPPGARRAAYWWVMDIRRYKVQAGYQPGAATDSRLGFSVMAFQSVELSSGLCGGNSRILVRFGGTRSRARRAGEIGDLLQRAKAGRCPCCARPIHIAAPD